jgi:hypothetical protein
MPYVNIASATTTAIKTGFGKLHKIVINKPVANGVITVYDNTAGSGNKIATITLPATLLQDCVMLDYETAFGTGLTIVTSAATDITVTYS